MRSSVSAALLAGLAGMAAAPPAALPPELATAQGPSGTAGTGDERYDRVGSAEAASDGTGVAGAHRQLPIGTVAEVTSLATGRNILLRMTGRLAPDDPAEIALTPAAARLLALEKNGGLVRVRAVAATPQDAAALARGAAAAPRLDAPPALLAALRRQQPAPTPRAPVPAAAATRRAPSVRQPASPARQPTPAFAPARAERFRVHVGAFSAQARAAALARAVGGSVEPAGGLWRVRTGPYPARPAAERARDAAARRGYAGAQIVPAS